MDKISVAVAAVLATTGLLLWWEIAASRWMHDFEWDHLEDVFVEDDVFGDPDSDYDETGNPVG